MDPLTEHVPEAPQHRGALHLEAWRTAVGLAGPLQTALADLEAESRTWWIRYGPPGAAGRDRDPLLEYCAPRATNRRRPAVVEAAARIHHAYRGQAGQDTFPTLMGELHQLRLAALTARPIEDQPGSPAISAVYRDHERRLDLARAQFDGIVHQHGLTGGVVVAEYIHPDGRTGVAGRAILGPLPGKRVTEAALRRAARQTPETAPLAESGAVSRLQFRGRRRLILGPPRGPGWRVLGYRIPPAEPLGSAPFTDRIPRQPGVLHVNAAAGDIEIRALWTLRRDTLRSLKRAGFRWRKGTRPPVYVGRYHPRTLEWVARLLPADRAGQHIGGLLCDLGETRVGGGSR